METIERFKNKLKIIKDFVDFLWARKLWWLIPMVLVLLLIGLVLIMAQGSVIAPFIYTLF
ncbi:MAG: hypothetical protein HYY63_02040 [Elusimicrobia bacterium]|nr:hypothetical protein [Elusimicrobiota bacterium]